MIESVYICSSYFFSISGSSATVYAYLGEFHDDIHRGGAIMGSALIFGVSCLLLPLMAYTVINQEWLIEVPLFDVVYKPWRLFVVVCGLPGLIASLAFFLLPESPKFVLGTGDQMEAIKIVEKMSRWNNGKQTELEIFEICEEVESIRNRQRIANNKNVRFSLVKSVWSQTAPLVREPYLGSTLLICVIQFGIYATSNGFYMFFADILNQMANNLDSFKEQRIKMCDVINMNYKNQTNISTNDFVSMQQNIFFLREDSKFLKLK